MSECDFFSDYAAFTTEKPFDFTKNSSIGCGGNAEIAFYPRTQEEMKKLLQRLQCDKVNFYVLGNLTNVLPADENVNKAVVSTKKLIGIQIGKRVFVEAGVKSGNLIRACRNAGKSGVEFLTGIPCTLGGALYMNAGVNGRYIAEIVESVFILRDGKTVVLPIEECKYGYKTSVFMNNGDVILGATLRLEDGDKRNIIETEKEYLKRRQHLPKGKSMGCVFKNPKGLFAGGLIEQAGLKGKRIGRAKISDTHANFIINENGATSEDIKTLIRLIKTEVEKKCNVLLQEEIRYLT
jgi:UDP-N-acetylmuramate dehydrogenase